MVEKIFLYKRLTNMFSSLILTSVLLFSNIGLSAEPSIKGPDTAAINQPVWLSLELVEGQTGKFDDKNPLLDTKPDHVAVNSALFFATKPGDYRIVAVGVKEKEIVFIEKTISVKDGVVPPTADNITKENVTAWLELVDKAVRDEVITHPLTKQTMSRQKAIGLVFSNIGKVGIAINSIAGMDTMLSTALAPTLGDSAPKWKDFADKIDAALSLIKDKTVEEYSSAYTIIGEVLTGDQLTNE